MTPYRIGGGHGEGLDPMVTDVLHTMQVGNSLKSLDLQGLEEVEFSHQTRFLTRLEPFCGFIPIKAHSKAPKVTFKGKPYLKLKECLSFNPAAIAIRSDRLACLDYDDERGLEYVSKRGINFTAQTWHIRKTTDNWNEEGEPGSKGLVFGRFKTLFVLTDEQAEEIGPCNSANQDYPGIDVFPKASPYIIISGKHAKEGNYYSPKGLDVVDLAPPSQAVLELLVEANRSKSTSKRSSSPNYKGDWIAARPCPICGRDKDDDCRTNKVGDVVLCHRGTTFHPPKMRTGEVINGWAFCGSGEDCVGIFSTFKKHQPTTLQAINKQLAARTHGRYS